MVTTLRFSRVLAAILCLPSLVAAAHAQTANETTLYNSTSASGYGQGFVIHAADGNYYGTAAYGGGSSSCQYISSDSSCGVIYRLTPGGTYTVLHAFTGIADGSIPTNLTQGSDGNFYGTTVYGGSGNCFEEYYDSSAPGGIGATTVGCGTVFRMTPSGSFSLLHSFARSSGASDGAYPNALVQGSDGNYYGTTLYGGLGGGVIFRITSSGSLTTLYEFTDGSDGAAPNALIQGSDGFFYGTTQTGGLASACADIGCGTVFKMSSSGALTTLYTFTGVPSGAANARKPSGHPSPLIVVRQPGAGYHMLGPAQQAVYLLPKVLAEGSDGRFYGTTPQQFPGYSENSTIYAVDSSGNLTFLYVFSASDANGTQGDANLSLFLAADGNFYGSGTVVNPPALAQDALFSISPSGVFSTVYTFTGGADGGSPDQLFPDSGGQFVGSLEGGGATGYGTIDAISPSPGIAAPVQLSFSPASVSLGLSTTLNWKVVNGFSTTLQQCYAFLQGSPSTGGSWAGLQTGAIANGAYTGSTHITPTAAGSYTYALTCGGIETGFATLVVGPALAVTTKSLPSGSVGTPYSVALAASGGSQPYLWTLTSGTLPQGLAFTGSTGLISGTPTQTGTFSLTFQLVDSQSPVAAQASATLSLTILPELIVTSDSVALGTVNTAYTSPLTATGGLAPYTWRITSGSLPPGIVLSSSTGVLSGRPTQSGTSAFTAQVADSESSIATASMALSLTVTPSLSLTAPTLPVATTAKAYTYTLAAAGGIAPYKWSVVSGSLPAGVTLGAATGILAGTPTQAGTNSFTVQVTDSESSPQTVAANLSIVTVTPLAVSTAALPTATTGVAYSVKIAATGGLAPLTYTVASGSLPAGLTLSSSTGILSGVATQPGSSAFTIQVSDSQAIPATTSASLTLLAVAPLVVTSTTLPGGFTGIAYSATLTATGGVAPYTWRLASGSLPAGLALAASTGVLSGTATQAFAGSLTFQVADSQSTPVLSSLAIPFSIQAAAITSTPATVTISAPGDTGTATLGISGFATHTITLACAGLPSKSSCTFGALSGTGSSGTVSLQLTTAPYAPGQQAALRMRGDIVYAILLPGLLLGGLIGRGRRRFKILVLFASAAIVSLTACASSAPGTPPGTYTVTVTATSTAQTATLPISFVIE